MASPQAVLLSWHCFPPFRPFWVPPAVPQKGSP
jgi:hypothetical protein